MVIIKELAFTLTTNPSKLQKLRSLNYQTMVNILSNHGHYITRQDPSTTKP